MILLRKVITIITTTLFLTQSIAYCGLSYHVVEIPDVLSSEYSAVTGISDNRWACGYIQYRDCGKVTRVPFVWHRERGYQEIEGLSRVAVPVAINNNGQVAGIYYDAGKRGFFWDPNFGLTDIGDLGGNEVTVYDINNMGHIVGSSKTGKPALKGNTVEEHAFIWKESKIIDLGTLQRKGESQGDKSCAFGINDEGWIIGWSNVYRPGRGDGKVSGRLVTLWNPNGIPQEIKLDDGDFQTKKTKITNDGWILAKFNKLWVYNHKTKEKRISGYGCDGIANADLVYSNSGYPTHLLIYGKNGYQPIEIPFKPVDGFWTILKNINAINQNGDFGGNAGTIYGEDHAIILLKD